jgi:hypothetical protein
MHAFFGSLAQLVEQRTFNPLVAGSNPARPTKEFQQVLYNKTPSISLAFFFGKDSSRKNLGKSVLGGYNTELFGSLAQLVEQRTFNPLVAGSNPARPTKNYQEAHEFRFVGFLRSGHSLVALAVPQSHPPPR